jgi:hypothetical protein
VKKLLTTINLTTLKHITLKDLIGVNCVVIFYGVSLSKELNVKVFILICYLFAVANCINVLDCGFSAHFKCSEKVPSDCCPDLKLFRGVFGIDLTTHVKAYKTNRPFVIDKCVEEIERRGMSVEGIYRVSGFQEEMDNLRLALDKGKIKNY